MKAKFVAGITGVLASVATAAFLIGNDFEQPAVTKPVVPTVEPAPPTNSKQFEQLVLNCAKSMKIQDIKIDPAQDLLTASEAPEIQKLADDMKKCAGLNNRAKDQLIVSLPGIGSRDLLATPK